MTREPDASEFLFFYRRDDVLEMHRLVRLHLRFVFQAVTKKINDRKWIEEQRAKFAKAEKEKVRFLDVFYWQLNCV